MTPQRLHSPDPVPDDAAIAYWRDRAAHTTGLAAVQPSGWSRYNAWANRTLQAWTLARLDRPRYRRLVDLGCGRGDWTAMFAPRADEVFACDVAPELVAETRARLDAQGCMSWGVECCDVRTYRIPAGADLVYVGAVLMYLNDAAVTELLARVRATARRDALVIARDFCTFNLGRRSEQRSTGWSVHRRPAELVALARGAGLRCDTVRSSPSIYAEQTSNWLTRWPLRVAWRVATAHWRRASHTFVFRT